MIKIMCRIRRIVAGILVLFMFALVPLEVMAKELIPDDELGKNNYQFELKNRLKNI